MIRKSYHHVFWALLLVQAVLTPTWAGPAADKAAAPVALPIGVADQAGQVGYVPGAKGGLEAINLETGEVLWTAKDMAKPLIVLGKLLLAQADVPDKANRVHIIALDVSAKGKRLLESEPLVFPEWVSVGVTYGRTFTAQASIVDGDLVYQWRANAFYAGGARPTPEIEEAARKEAAGIARVNLITGKVTMLPAQKAPAEPKVKLPDELAKVKSQQYWTGADWKTDLFSAGKTVSALDVKQAGGISQMSLKRWDLTTGKSLETVNLLRGKELWPQISLDGQYVFVHQALVKEQLPAGDYAWWVFALETGKQVSKFPFEAPLDNVTVIGPRAYHLVTSQRVGPGAQLQPRSLRAVDLKSGKTAWERPVQGQRVLLPLP